MTEVDRSVRLRAALSTWFSLVLIALVLTTVVLGWWSYQVNMVPETEQDERLVEQWSESTAYDHGADLINESLAFEGVDRVENRPIYYTNLATELDGTYTYSFAASGGEVTTTTETYLLIRGGELDGNEVVSTYWELARPLESETSVIGPDEKHRVDFTVDVPFVLETIATVEEELGSTEGLVDVRIVSVSRVEGVVEGDAVEHTHRSELLMIIEPSTFRVIDSNVVTERHETFETVEVIVHPGPMETYGSIVLFVLSAVAALALGLGRSLGYIELTDRERELIDIEQDRKRFDEWITTGTFPSEREYDQTVLVDDLEGLVDVAIDTNKRVIEDPQLGASTVLDDDFIYIYVRPDSPARDWLVRYADTTMDEFEKGEF